MMIMAWSGNAPTLVVPGLFGLLAGMTYGLGTIKLIRTRPPVRIRISGRPWPADPCADGCVDPAVHAEGGHDV